MGAVVCTFVVAFVTFSLYSFFVCYNYHLFKEKYTYVYPGPSVSLLSVSVKHNDAGIVGKFVVGSQISFKLIETFYYSYIRELDKPL